jgi:hypothetical protein
MIGGDRGVRSDLMTGARDTSVMVWDVVVECGVARLEGPFSGKVHGDLRTTRRIVMLIGAR